MERPRIRLRLLALSALAVLVFAAEARADGIDMSMVFAAGLIVLVPLLAFNVLVEGLVLAPGLKVRYRAVLALALGANFASLLAGIPVAIFDEFLHDWLLPRDLAPYFRAFPWVVALGTLVYFVVTVLVEFGVVWRWTKRRSLGIGMKRVAVTVLLANVATYAVLAPLNYFVTRPTTGGCTFTDTSSWASRPLTTIYYADTRTGGFCFVASDGSGRREFFRGDIKDFQFSDGGKVVLYVNKTDNLCLWTAGAAKPVECGRVEQWFNMDRAAAAPDGSCVAWLKEETFGQSHRLVLFDPRSGRTRESNLRTTDKDRSPMVAWSTSPDVLLISEDNSTQAFRVTRDLSLTPAEIGTDNAAVATVYGRFNNGDYTYANYDADAVDNTEVRTRFYLFSHVAVTRNGVRFVLDDNPGFLGFPNRVFEDVSILANGRELLFDDQQGLYLMDMNKRIVGKIADGTAPVIESQRYRKKLPDLERKTP